MTGQQHAVIGIGAALPVGVFVALELPVGFPWAPAWLAGAAGASPSILTSLVVAGALVGALAPDLDSERSLLESTPRVVLRRLQRWPIWLRLVLAPILLILGASLWLINEVLLLLTSHRGLTHGLPVLVLVVAGVWLATAWVMGPALALGVGLGYASHVLADALTPRGVELLAPLSRRRWHLLPRPLRFGGQSWRAGCLTTLVLLTGFLVAAWQVWHAVIAGV